MPYRLEEKHFRLVKRRLLV